MIESIMFYVFATFIIIGACAVILSKNPVYSVLALIFTFFNSAGIFVLQKAEFLAMTLIIVYVGAVAILFLFVVMFINLKSVEARKYYKSQFVFAVIITVLLGVELFVMIKSGLIEFTSSVVSNAGDTENLLDIKRLGIVLFNNYYYVFILSGILLTGSMIGAVAIIGRETTNNHKQNIAVQNYADKAHTVNLVKVSNEEGIK